MSTSDGKLPETQITLPAGKQKFGHYEIVKELGRGGMGIVYLAHDPRLNRPVAIKTLLVADETGEKHQRFLREANAMAQLHHPNIIQVYDIGQQGSTPFFVMEFIEGETLEQVISRNDMPVDEALRVMETVASTIDYIHRQKMLHRDLKPANIMIDKLGNIKVMDFGLTKASESGKLSQDGVAVGTIGYIAPEQYDGRAEQRSDVYALGVILYRLLAGVPPFAGESLSSVLWNQLQTPAVPPSQRNPRVPGEVDAVVLKAFEYDKDMRYGSAKELAADIARCLKGEKVIAGPGVSRKWSRRRQALALAGIMLIAGGVLALVSWLPARSKVSQPEQAKRTFAEADFEAASKPEKIIAIAEVMIESALLQDDWKTAKNWFGRAYGKVRQELGDYPKQFAPIAQKILHFIPRLIPQDHRAADVWLGAIEPYLKGDPQNHAALKYYVRVIHFAGNCLRKTPGKNWDGARQNWREMSSSAGDDRYAAQSQMFLAYLYWQKGLAEMATGALEAAKQKGFRFAQRPECRLLEQDSDFKRFLNHADWQEFWKTE